MDVSAAVSKLDIKKWLIENVGQMLMMSYDDIDCDAHLTELGMDSQEIMSLIGQLEDWLGCRFDSSVTENPGSINSLVDAADDCRE